jgi:hypothetical protein
MRAKLEWLDAEVEEIQKQILAQTQEHQDLIRGLCTLVVRRNLVVVRQYSIRA